MKWEYRFEVLDFSSSESAIENATSELNKAGKDGWEVVSIMPKMGHKESWCIALLKRPVTQS
jgi:hypothetical protein